MAVAFAGAAAPLIGRQASAAAGLRACRARALVGGASLPARVRRGGSRYARRPAQPAMAVGEEAETKTTPSPPALSGADAASPTPMSGNGVSGNGAIVDGADAKADLTKDITQTVAWVVAAAAVAAGVGYWLGVDRGLEFVAAYVVEYSLSVDNLLVFLILFQHFNVPRPLQTRVLKWGIIGAITFRGIMIVAGEALTHRFEWVTVLFGIVLFVSAAKLILPGGEEEEDIEANSTVRFARRLLPFSDAYDGDRFFTTGADGARLATPLMLVLLSVEFSDVVFALDSVPAVLGISSNTFVIYASNVMAILGLRSLYFVLADAIGDLRFLQPALAVVLGFVGGKMVAGVGGYEVGILPSLGVIAACLGGGVGASVLFPEAEGGGEADKKA